MIIINSSLLLIISNAIDVIEEIINEAKINPLCEINLEKYVKYNIGSSKECNINISTINDSENIQKSEETSTENQLMMADDISMDVKAQVGDRILSNDDTVYEGK